MDIHSAIFMTEFYLDMETTGFDPKRDRIITIQFQELDTKTGAARGSLEILREWESSEKDVLKEFLDVLDPSNDWNFVPIGYNLLFDFRFLQARISKLLRIELQSDWLYHGLPHVDIKNTLIMINEGSFKGTTLDWFVQKEMDDSLIPKWYAKKNYSRIEEYISDKTKRFIHAYQFLKEKLPLIYEEYQPML